MSRAIRATCQEGIVTAESVPVPDAEILSEGIGPSSGIVLLDEDEATYLTSNSGDLKSALDTLSGALNNIASALTSLDTAAFLVGVTGGGGSPAVGVPGTPVATSAISEVNTAKAQIDTLKGNLK